MLHDFYSIFKNRFEIYRVMSIYVSQMFALFTKKRQHFCKLQRDFSNPSLPNQARKRKKGEGSLAGMVASAGRRTDPRAAAARGAALGEPVRLQGVRDPRG